jgi:hypothetical protein
MVRFLLRRWSMASPGFGRSEWKGVKPALSVATIDVGGIPVLGKQGLAGLHSISDCYGWGFVAREEASCTLKRTLAAGLHVDLLVSRIGPSRTWHEEQEAVRWGLSLGPVCPNRSKILPTGSDASCMVSYIYTPGRGTRLVLAGMSKGRRY